MDELLDENFKYNYIKGEVKNGLEEGEWKGETFSKYLRIIYSKGKIISSSSNYKRLTDTLGGAGTYVSVEQVPAFPGGMSAFGRFIEQNLHYPINARKNNTSGRVIVSFIVEKDGTLSNVRVARGIGDGCDEEAVRVIESSPKWTPGIQNNKPVRVAFSIPIAFNLNK